MEIFGIKIGNEILLTNPLILQILLIIITLAVVKIAFGKEIIWGARKTWEHFSYKDKSKQHDDRVADCVQRNGWIQKGDAEFLPIQIMNYGQPYFIDNLIEKQKIITEMLDESNKLSTETKVTQK